MAKNDSANGTRSGYTASIELLVDGGFYHLLTVQPRTRGNHAFASTGAAELRVKHVLRELETIAKGVIRRESDGSVVKEVEL